MGRDDSGFGETLQDDADRAESIGAAQEQQAESGDEPDSYEDFKDAETDAMADAADEGQIFTKE